MWVYYEQDCSQPTTNEVREWEHSGSREYTQQDNGSFLRRIPSASSVIIMGCIGLCCKCKQTMCTASPVLVDDAHMIPIMRPGKAHTLHFRNYDGMLVCNMLRYQSYYWIIFWHNLINFWLQYIALLMIPLTHYICSYAYRIMRRSRWVGQKTNQPPTARCTFPHNQCWSRLFVRWQRAHLLTLPTSMELTRWEYTSFFIRLCASSETSCSYSSCHSLALPFMDY
jgi:hypothetical protein